MEYLDWSPHLNSIVTKAYNISNYPRNVPSEITIRICMCGMGPISNKIKDIANLEKVQRKAARFVKQDYSKYKSVTRMIHEVVWKKPTR